MKMLAFDTCLDKTYVTFFDGVNFDNKVITSNDKNYHSAYLISTIVEVLKKPAACHKSEIKSLGKIMELIIKILTYFSSPLENRNYMIVTNRISVIADLLLWVLNKPTKIPLGISFLSDLISIIIVHVKHIIIILGKFDKSIIHLFFIFIFF